MLLLSGCYRHMSCLVATYCFYLLDKCISTVPDDPNHTESSSSELWKLVTDIVRFLQMSLLSNVFLFFLISTMVFAGLRKRKPCVNGSPEGDRCYCIDGWTGAFCHRRMNCNGFERKDNGSSEDGNRVNNLDVVALKSRVYFTKSRNGGSYRSTIPVPVLLGQFCESFVTKDIYSYYNNIVSKTGALGILTIIPLFLIYASCERCAKRRQQQRVEKHLTGTMFTHPEKTVNSEAIAQLLERVEEE
uniref:EGF-like domain-containing protein n=1 Tax=Heterorhabditis bacteriophora TaxID=37862 RepID=A0A1I7XQJ4_HETBA